MGSFRISRRASTAGDFVVTEMPLNERTKLECATGALPENDPGVWLHRPVELSGTFYMEKVFVVCLFAS